MITKLRLARLMLLFAALGWPAAAALGQVTVAAHATGPPAGSIVVTGNIRTMSAGVITLIDGTSVFINRKTKLPDGPPTPVSRIRVTGTRVAKGNINATKIQIVK